MKSQASDRRNTKPSIIVLTAQSVIACANLLALAGSIAYLIRPTPYLFHSFYALAVFLALYSNVAFTVFKGNHRWLDYGYLLLHIVSMLLIPVLNTLASSDVHNKASQSVFVLVLYIILFGLGAANAGLRIIAIRRIAYNIDRRGSGPYMKTRMQQGGSGNAMRWIAVALLCLCLLFGIYLSYILLDKHTGKIIEVFVPEYSLFWGLLIFGVSFFIVKIRWRNKGSVVNKIVVALGIMIFAISLVPLVSTYFIKINADAAYREAFGGAYLDDEAIGRQPGFMQKPFSLQDYFLGIRTSDYTLKENVLYHEERPGGARLHFDAYIPPAGEGSLPAKNPVLIRIHGGAWTIGDKGASNYSGTNKHFVNQGYVVFDIQYGLNNQVRPFGGLPGPAGVQGDFDIDDMVRHVGVFTAYLADHADEYGADLDAVFFTGASAGGQLAVAAALGIAGGKYAHILDSRLRVKGLIPFYPANGLSAALGIGGAPDLVDPALLVDANSPPCLIYHGTHDGIVDPKYASILLDAYREKGGAPCALLWMNFASHGSDIYTPGFYNQIFTYYMERFMYQFR